MEGNWSADSIKALETLRNAADSLNAFNERRLSTKRRKQTLTVKLENSMQKEKQDVSEIKFDEVRRELTPEEKAFEAEFGYGGAIFETDSPFVRDRYEELRYKAWASIPREGQTYVDFAGYRLGEPIGQYRRHCPVPRRDGISEDLRGEPQSMEAEHTDKTTENGTDVDRVVGRYIGVADNGRNEHGPESITNCVNEGIREKGMATEKNIFNEGASKHAVGVNANQSGDREADVFLPRRSSVGRYGIEEMQNSENKFKEKKLKENKHLDIEFWAETKDLEEYKKKIQKYAKKKAEFDRVKRVDNLVEYANSTLDKAQLKSSEQQDSTDGNSITSILMGTLCGTTASELPGTEEKEETKSYDSMPILLAAVTAVRKENDLSRWRGIVEHGWSNVGKDKVEQKQNIEYYIHPDGMGMRKFRDQIWTMTGTSKYGFKASLRQTIYAIRDRLVEKGFDPHIVKLALQKRDFSHFDMEHIICRMRDHSDF